MSSINTTDDFVPGDFSYLEPSSTRAFVEDAYNVITKNEWWTKLRNTLKTDGVNPEEGFMFSTNPFYLNIMEAISKTHIGGLHSGSSMGFCMREMEYIALHGELEYKRNVIKRKEKEQKRANLINSILAINPDIDLRMLKAILAEVIKPGK